MSWKYAWHILANLSCNISQYIKFGNLKAAGGWLKGSFLQGSAAAGGCGSDLQGLSLSELQAHFCKLQSLDGSSEASKGRAC